MLQTGLGEDHSNVGDATSAEPHEHDESGISKHGDCLDLFVSNAWPPFTRHVRSGGRGDGSTGT